MPKKPIKRKIYSYYVGNQSDEEKGYLKKELTLLLERTMFEATNKKNNA